MKKGFTLIELIAVILLLGLIGLVVFPSVLNQMKTADKNISEATRKIIYSAADDYINYNKEQFKTSIDNNNDIVLELNTLVNEGYLSNNIDLKDYDYVEVDIESGKILSFELIKSE